MKYIPYLCDVMQELRPNQTWQVVDDGGSSQKLSYDPSNSKPVPTEDELLEESGKMEDKLNWRDFRRVRNNKLAETDWMANSDVTMSDAWKTYRQALRDLPANTSDPVNPTWPTKPE